MEDAERKLTQRLWDEVAPCTEGGSAVALPPLRLLGDAGGLPSPFHVGSFATACVAVATLAASELHAARTERPARAAIVDRCHAALAFRSERYARRLDEAPIPVWDPLSGDYPTRSGIVRLHTNYEHHRAAVVRALGVAETREAVRSRLQELDAEDVEARVVAEGGAAAKLRTRDEWRAHEQGRAVSQEPLAFVRRSGVADVFPREKEPERPLSGLRVLDLTRVVAGPVCTRVLASHGADVLRIDPPGFAEVPALLADTTGGKRRAALDLKSPDGRARFLSLLAEADLFVHGLRSDALSRLGLAPEVLEEVNPRLSVVTHDAYGFTGPWCARRGFDSLVQMSVGIAARGRDVYGGDLPVPLPAQALDHGTGYLLAAAACRALARRLRDGSVTTVRLSLARTAELLVSLGDDGDPHAPELPADAAAPYLERVCSAFGEVERLRCPGVVEGLTSELRVPPGPLGVDPAAFP